MASYDEMMKGQADRLSGNPNSVKTEKSVGSETQGLDMKINAPMSDALDSNKGGGTGHMGKAVSFLNSQVR